MGKTVLITGGNKGIGLETTRLFIENGDTVCVVARDFRDFPLRGKVNEIVFDVFYTEKIGPLIEKIGKVDVLINNAGIMNSLPFDDYPDDAKERLCCVNIDAPIAFITAVSKTMQSGGRIVNVASVAGQIGHPDVWYGITKAGLINATKSFAKLLGPRGIVVNAVAPGPVETDMLHVIPEKRRAEVKASVYSGRFATPNEVAKAIYWLATDCPEYINGTCMDINNGSFPR